MPRSRNAAQRRQVMAAVVKLKNNLARIRATWDVATTVYVDRADRKPGDNAYLRERQTDEYHENQTEAWAQLYNEADDAITQLTALRRLALERYHQLKAQEQPAAVDGAR